MAKSAQAFAKHHSQAIMSGSSRDSSSSSSSEEETQEVWTGNEGDSSDNDEEVAASSSLRGMAFLVTAACPRKYPREQAVRKAKRMMIPEDFSKEEFLNKLRRVVAAHCNQRLEKATCHDEPHQRFRQSRDKRERHKHVAGLMSGNFAHKKIAEAFFKEHGIRISISFKLKRFVGNLQYLMVAGKKPSTDLDLDPAKYPPNLDLKKELDASTHPGETPASETREHKKRKRLSFDEVSNVIVEGIGAGPLRSVKALEEAARTLKHRGSVELWNYLGAQKSSAETVALVSKVWRLQGEQEHPMWHKEPPFALSMFRHDGLAEVKAWIDGKYRSHVLVLSGDGGLGKTTLAEALIATVCPAGYWFIDDPDDLRELEGQL